MKPGRIPCLNPRCRRTAPADKYPPGTEIICGKCFRNLPKALKERHRRHERRYRKLRRAYRRREVRGTLPGLVGGRFGHTACKVLDASWVRIRRYYREPERPHGLDAFLEEAGLA